MRYIGLISAAPSGMPRLTPSLSSAAPHASQNTRSRNQRFAVKQYGVVFVAVAGSPHPARFLLIYVRRDVPIM